MNLSEKEINYILSPLAIRERCQRIWELAQEGKTHFKINEDKIEACANFVLEVIRDNYPSLDIPFHSRWGHFQTKENDRLSLLAEKLQSLDPLQRAYSKIDLVIVSVLLDAGAGNQWQYIDPYSQKAISRSEGLALASFDMFMQGYFSSTKEFSADAKALSNFKEESLIAGFQVSEANPLVGVAGRVSLLNNLGQTLNSHPEFFPNARPSGILKYLENEHGNSFEVQDILKAVLLSLGNIWPGRISAGEVNLGDTWPYPFERSHEFENLVCFHKLSQWLTYSLVDPIIEAGFSVTGAHKLTGLAEYRNGGLFIDMGILELRDPSQQEKAHGPEAPLIIEWRALTICLLDKMANIIQTSLQKTSEQFPLAKVLEGGTWHAGRRIAKEKRDDASPPLTIESDGTVF